MVDRWTVERAIRDPDCELAPPGRHIGLTLLTWTDHHNATIPEKFTPSLTDLEKATGLARSTVAKWLNELERLGWLVRDRPSVAAARRKKQRTVYALRVPARARGESIEVEVGPPRSPAPRDSRGSAGPPGAPAKSDSSGFASQAGGPTGSDSPGSAGPPSGPAVAGVGPLSGPELVRQPDRTGPLSGLSSYRENDLPVERAGDADHRYVEGANGYCSVRGCGRSAPLHGRRLAAVPEQRTRVSDR